MTLLICRTCPRYDPHNTGTFGQQLTAAITEQNTTDQPITTRNVLCLGGCPDHGVVALDAPGKARVRFTRISPDQDTAELLDAARSHDSSSTGEPGEWEVPTSLEARVSSVTLKRNPENL